MAEILHKRHSVDSAKVEFRTFDVQREELRAGAGVVLRGYASVFNSPSEWLGFRELVAPGAFSRSLESGSDIKALVEHDPARIVARTDNGSLQVGEDAHGLWVRIEPNDSTEGRDLVENVRTGLLTQMSIGFRVLEETWQHHDGEEVRTLTQVDLVECSVVADPAYTATEIGLADRSADVEAIDVVESTEVDEVKPESIHDYSVLLAKLAMLDIDDVQH